MVQFKTYERGSIIMVNFNPSLGHEQQGYRPALVWTNKEAQTVTGLVSIFPITSHDKNFPLHVPINGRAGDVVGVVMVDQITSIDLTSRPTKLASRAEDSVMAEVEEIFAEMTA